MKMQPYSRRQFTSQLVGGVISLGLSPTLFAQKPLIPGGEIDWYDLKDIGVEGKGWTDTKRYFDRLPSKAEGMVREAVWESFPSFGRYVHAFCIGFPQYICSL